MVLVIGIDITKTLQSKPTNLKHKKLKAMKNLITLIAAIVLVTGLTSTVKAQNGVFATATGSATIITPISIVNAGDMNFGNIAVDATSGTVVLTSAGARTRTGGVTLPVSKGTVSAAKFTVKGQVSSTYSITLPTTALTLTSGTSNSMTVTGFTSDITGSLTSGAGTLAADGTQTINVGATLNVGASQAAGLYVSGTPFAVTVNYN